MNPPVAIVAGAAGAVGRAFVAIFLESGARVVMAAVKGSWQTW